MDLALFESVFRMLEPLVAEYGLTGQDKGAGGPHQPGDGARPAPSSCRDGKWVVMVTSTDRTFARLAEVMGRTDLLSDPRFDTNPHRAPAPGGDLDIVQEWFLQHECCDVVQLLDDNGVPVVPDQPAWRTSSRIPSTGPGRT